MTSKREKLVAIFRLLVGIGILLMMIVFLRACLSPPQLPSQRGPASPDAPPANSSALPSRY